MEFTHLPKQASSALHTPGQTPSSSGELPLFHSDAVTALSGPYGDSPDAVPYQWAFLGTVTICCWGCLFASCLTSPGAPGASAPMQGCASLGGGSQKKESPPTPTFVGGNEGGKSPTGAQARSVGLMLMIRKSKAGLVDVET